MSRHQAGSLYVAYNMDCMTSAEEGGGSMPQHQTGSLYVAYNMDDSQTFQTVWLAGCRTV